MKVYAFRLLILSLCLSTTLWAVKNKSALSIYGDAGIKYKEGQPFDHANPHAPKGGHLVLASISTFTKLNPVSLKGLGAPGLGLVFQTPMDGSLDDAEPFTQYGVLVEKVELAKDRMSMVYHLHKNARFSDGKPVTADDFVFSVNIMKNDPQYHPLMKQYLKDIKSAKRIDRHTVKITFSVYNQELPLITGQLTVLPKHIYGKKEKKFGRDFDAIAVGSGPYVIDKYEFGKYIRYKRNTRWWAKDLAINKGRYNFEFITYKVFLDQVAMREAFKGGAYDIENVNISRDWALDYKGKFQKLGYYIRKEIPHNRVAGMQGFAMNLRKPYFKSRKARAAVAMAFDFDWSNKNLFYGQYTRFECFFDNNKEMKGVGLPKNEVGQILKRLQKKHGRKHVPKTVFTKPMKAPGQGSRISKNIKMARALLDSDGWKLGKDGIRTKDGKKFEIELLTYSTAMERVIEPYTSNLRKIGIKAKAKVVQMADYEKRLRNFEYDMMVGVYGQSLSPGNEQRYFWGSEAADTPGSRNYAGIKNPAVDELIQLIIDAKTRKGLVTAVQALDRVLVHQYYLVHQWYIAYDRVAYWNKFAQPKNYASRGDIDTNAINWWWWDEKKIGRLKQAKQKGIALK